MQRIKSIGINLKEFVGVSPLYGSKTGLNEAFVINGETKKELVKQDSRSLEIIKPFLRGQDIGRWTPQYADQWMIYTTNDVNLSSFPAIEAYLEKYREKLEARAGRQDWWQLQGATGTHHLFARPKIIYQVIQYLPQYSFDDLGLYGNDKTYFLPTADLYLLGLLNSPLMWWYNWRYFGDMKDHALNPANSKMEVLPIAPPTDEIRSQVEPIVTRLIEITKTNQESIREVLDWLRMEQSIEKLGNKLEDFASLDCDQFVQEIKKRKPKDSGLNPKALKEVREVYNDYAPKIQAHPAEALSLEIQLSDLVNQAYGLTPEEIDLMWKTAPPRMPIPNPNRKGE